MVDKMNGIDALLEVMAALRHPETGCPWDLEQDFVSIAPYTIEEAYEVDDAIRRGSMDDLKSELGDLLLQVVFHAQMAEDGGHFVFNDVAQGIADKMITRHPHVFGGASIEDADAQTAAWEEQKAEERAERARAEGRIPSVLDDLTLGLPALLRALKIQKRVARVGFDWPSTTEVMDKVVEEMEELKEAHATGTDFDHLEEEMGDLLFVVANMARHMKIDPEEALRKANAKFERRFRAVEGKLEAKSLPLKDVDLQTMEAAWQDVKKEEKAR